ncbi:MAG: hypothetical protein H5T86_16465 [Armatimonadetes bacterium]|nr:hypothetical protein [Armatimonadota bacterium]
MVFLAAYGALQDWAAVYPFSFGHNDRWTADAVESYFDYRSNPVQLVTFPWAAVAMRRRGVEPAKEQVLVPATVQDAIAAVVKGQRYLSALDLGATIADVLGRRVAIQWGQGGARPAGGQAEVSRYSSDNGQVVWDVSQSGRAFLLVRGAAAKAFVGYAAGIKHDLGDGVSLVVEPTSIGWATVTLAQLEGAAVGKPGNLLITAAAAYRNPGWGWEELGQNRVTLRRNWGKGPVEVEGVAAQIELPVSPSRIQAFALDPLGKPARPVQVSKSERGCTIDLSPDYQTLWYLVRVR